MTLTTPASDTLRNRRCSRPAAHTLAAAFLALGLASSRAGAQIAGCSGSLPPGLSVVDELRHDDGSPAQFVTGAAGPGGSQRVIHHGNRFVGNGQTITHVCVYAEDPGETIEIYFASGDDTTFGDVRPSLPSNTYTDTIQGGYQLIDISPPVQASGVFWIVAVFPDATPNNGHMGVTTALSPGVHGEAYVGVMPGAPGGMATWTDYEDVPGGAPYAGYRPLIRGLELAAAPTCTGATVMVNTLGSLQTTEPGGTAQLSVSLAGPVPTHNVLALLSTSDPTEGTLNSTVLIFTPATHTVPQPVTVSGIDDLLLDGDMPYTIDILLSSLDACYHGLTAPAVPVVNLDDDGVIPPNGLCCMGTTCDPTLTPADCAASGGTWNGAATACNHCCPGDADGNGVVDIDDVLVVILAFGSSGTPGITGDVDLDGDVDIDDVVLVILNFGALC